MKNVLSKKEMYISFLTVAVFCLFVEKIAFSNQAFNIFRFFLITSLLVLMVLLIKLISYSSLEKKLHDFYNRIGINKLFIIFGITIGIASSFLVPFNEIPDEVAHINFVYSERGINLEYADINDGYYGTPDVMINNSNKIKYSQYFDFSKRIDTGVRFGVPKVTIIRHFPQIIATVISEALKLPMFIYLAMGELFALLFYIFVCNKALKLMPFKKNTLMFIMLLPVCVQQMASFSYDVVLNSFCFLYIASIFKFKFINDKISGIDLLKLLFYIFVITICKIPYGILGLLLLILPLKKVELKIFSYVINYVKIKDIFRRHMYLYTTLMFLFVIGILLIAYKLLIGMSIGRVLITSLINFKATLLLFKRSIHIFLHYYFESISGNLGLFNVKTPIVFEIIIYFSLLFVTFTNIRKPKKDDHIEYKFSKFDIFIIYTVFLLMVYIIILSMFEWTLYVSGVENYTSLSMNEIKHYIISLPFIGGVQGRYFIPIIPLICLSIKSKTLYGITDKLSPYSYQFAYYIMLFSYFVITMLLRFWI